jgi:UDP-glucose 4-epimerase
LSRVLVTDGSGALGHALVRRLLRDPDFEVRIAATGPVPDWMREGCSVHTGDLRDVEEVRRAMDGCAHVIHLGGLAGGVADRHARPHTLAEVNHALLNALFAVAVELHPERLVHISSALVFERADQFPATEASLPQCPPPRSPYAWSRLAGEVYCRAAHAEHGLRYTICRPFGAYGPGELPGEEPGIAHLVPDLLSKSLQRLRPLPILGSGRQTRTPTHATDLADGIVTAMAHPNGLNDDFNLAATEELTVAEIAHLCWEAAGNDPTEFELEPHDAYEDDLQRSWPSVEKADRLLDWRAHIGAREGFAATADWLRR